ncbi:glycosyltransferase [Azonexus sp. IMCC34842]|uniref:glycosyltransferase n=1 Tax=Azonexus sp. IMCC34842 TaxID=3420950 RepID=UPI003D09DC19
MASTYPRWPGDHEPGFVHELNRRLAHEFEIHVVCPRAPGAAEFEVMDGVAVHRFCYAPKPIETLVQGGGILSNLRQRPWKWVLVPSFFIGMMYQTFRCLRRIQPNCIHAHWIIPQGVALAVLGTLIKNVPPFLLTSHGSDLFCLRGKLFAMLKRWVLGKAATTTVVSYPMVAEVIKFGGCPERISVIPMGVDFASRFSLTPLMLRVPGEILFVGRLVESKGLKYLIEAMPIIRRQVQQVNLVVIGDGPELQALRTLVASMGLNCVQFLGSLPQEKLPDFYRRASVFVAPFIGNEGLGLVTVEAIACACPVVVGDIPAMADIFLDTELEMRAAPRNSSALAEKVVAVLLDCEAATQRILEIRKRLEVRLGWTRVTQLYAEKLRGLSSPSVI